MMLSTFETVAVLAKSPKVTVSLPAPRSIEALEATVAYVMMSAPVPPTSALDVRDRARVVEVAERELVAAGAEIDAVGAGERRAESDGVGLVAADERLDVGDGRRVGEVAERERCRCREPRSIDALETCAA